MSASERRKFVLWFDQHRHELLPEIETAQQAEVLTRLAETEAKPELIEPFEEADVEQMFKDWAASSARNYSVSIENFALARCFMPSVFPASAV